MTRDVLLQLIDKYLAGKASPEEQHLLQNYFESFQESTDWNEQELGARDVMEQQLLQKLRTSLAIKPKAGIYPLRRKWLLAAGILAALIGGYLFWNLLYKWNNKVAMREVLTGLQERKQVRLPDGTAIWLEPGSRLLYPEKFSAGIRDVTFLGEAFFEVAKDAQRPFVIHTGTIRTSVLGTSFAVKAYDTAMQEVAVVTGRVRVEMEQPLLKGGQSVTVVPNQKATWNNSSRRLQTLQLTSTQHYAQRRYGKFIYQGETVAAVLDDIAHQYNVQVQYDAAIGACTFYGDFDIKQPVGTVLNTLAAALNTQLIKEKASNAYRLVGGGCFATRL